MEFEPNNISFLSFEPNMHLTLGWGRKKKYSCVCLAKTGWSQRKINSSNMFPKVSFSHKMPPPIPKNYLHHELNILIMVFE